MPLQTNYSYQQSALLQDVEQQSEDGFLDYASFGTASAIISGGTGLINTVIGMGEMLGIVDEGNQLDEGRAVTTLLGQEGGDFYLRHKQGIDIVGLVASSIVPGMAGVKALRAVQKSGLIYNPMKYSTGLKNADIILDSPQVNAAKAAALNSRSTSILSPEYYKAVGSGFKQQVMENVAFSAGMILVNNQNTTLNPDDLSYLDAAGAQVIHDLPWVAAGAVLGTAIDALRIGSAVRKSVQAEHSRVVFTTEAGKEVTAGALRNLNVPELRGMNGGDAIIALAADSTAMSKIQKGLYMQDGNGAEVLPEVNKFAYNNIMDAGNIRNTEFNTIVASMNKAGKEGFNTLKGMYDDIANGATDRKYALAALEEIKYLTPKAVRSVDTAQIVLRKQLDDVSIKMESREIVTKAELLALGDDALIGIGTRMGQAGSKHEAVLAESLVERFPQLFSLNSIKANGLQTEVSKVISQADELADAGKIGEDIFASVQAQKLTAFVNTTTKEVRSKITPRLSDFGKTKIMHENNIAKATLYSGALKQTFKYDAAAFSAATRATLVGGDTALPTIKQLDANFQLAHSIKMNYASKKPTVIEATDVAMLERVLKDMENPKYAKLFENHKVQIGNQAATTALVRSTLIDSKSRLIANLQEQGFNADDIAIAANTSERVVLAEEPLNAANAIGRTTYDSPEWLEVSYLNRNIKDYNKQVDDFTGQAQRDKLYQTQKQIALAELGHYDLVTSLPSIRVEDLGDLTNLADRTGLFKRFDAMFGSMRETMGYIGLQVNRAVKESDASIGGDFANFEGKLNKPESGLLRAELELAVNFMRTGDISLVEGSLVRTDLIKGALKQAEKEAAEGAEQTVDIAGIISSLGKGDAVHLSEDLLPVFAHWEKVQATNMQARSSIAATLGTNRAYDPMILRAPPVNLAQYRMQAFVRPSKGQAANDPTNYVLYAQTLEELNTKIAEAQIRLGDSYHIIRKGEDQEFYKAMQQYEYGHEFRDLFADMAKANKGRTADALPELGSATSRALSDMKISAMRNAQYRIRASVELQNAEALEQLRRYGNFADNAERTALTTNLNKRGSHIYNDSVAVMLDLPGFKGNTIEHWNSINTAVAQRGSKVIDFISAQGEVLTKGINIVKDTYTKLRGKDLEARAFDWDSRATQELSELMQTQGYADPLVPIMELVSKSSDPAVSNSAAQISRNLANLVSLTMLRADPTHSLMQLTSSTILSLPVLKELQKTLPDVAARLTGVTHPTTGIIEPTIAKLYAKGNAKAFSKSPESTKFMADLKQRGIITDYISQMLDSTDLSVLNGSHTIADINSVTNKIGRFLSKWSGHTKSEEVSRFALADSVREMCVARGIPEKEMWPIISNAVNKVHGNYIASQRPQLFNGVIGQNVGLFQTYFFNMMQHVTRHVGNGDKKQLALLGGLQAGMFGGQSIPGFGMLNQLVAQSSNYEDDLYSITDANDPKSYSSYGMFGLASQAFGIDFSGRGNLNPRYATIVPTDFANLATVNVMVNAVGNLYKTAGMIADENISVGTALAHGLAHNGMNRPLQGLGTILQNAVTSNTGQVDVANANMDPAGNLAWATMFSRVIGARPMDEAIVRSHFYRQAGYDAAHRDEMAKLGATIQMDGVEDWGQIATEYENAGGNLQQFNAFVVRNMQTASEGKLGKFKQETETETQLNRSINRMQLRDSLKPYWEP